MAKRYSRINFQNAPSTATPLNDTNLNKIDKVLDELDNAVGDLTELTSPNKKDLVLAINSINLKMLNRQALEAGKTVSLDTTNFVSYGGVYLVITHHSGTIVNFRGAYIVFCSSDSAYSGTVVPLLSASSVNISLSGMKITIKNTESAGTCYISVLQLM